MHCITGRLMLCCVLLASLPPYSPLHTESSTTPTSTPTAEAIDAAIITAQTNSADFDFAEVIFSHFATTFLMKEMIYVID